MKTEDITLTIALSLLALICGLSYWFGLFLPTLAQITKENGYVEWLGFFGNLIGALVTLLAAAIAFIAVRIQVSAQQHATDRQIAREQARDEQSWSDAKQAAITILRGPTYALATIDGLIECYFLVSTSTDLALVLRADAKKNLLARIRKTHEHLRRTTGSVAMAEIWKTLRQTDKVKFLSIAAGLETFAAIYLDPPTELGADDLLSHQHGSANAIYLSIAMFDFDLSFAYRREADEVLRTAKAKANRQSA